MIYRAVSTWFQHTEMCRMRWRSGIDHQVNGGSPWGSVDLDVSHVAKQVCSNTPKMQYEMLQRLAPICRCALLLLIAEVLLHLAVCAA